MRGRPVFSNIMKQLRQRKADGIILHKIDRGARNLKDWADIAELTDTGIEVHFANESVDLNTRGGRLSADIQAVVAADFIRNLREETKKGYYGRLKQGLCPRPAPLGYLNNGVGKRKTIDPVQGPIVREAFELYASGRFSLARLTEELYKRGLRTRQTEKYPGGEKVGRSGVAAILSNPFYIGILYIKKTKQTFLGVHEPLISRYLFEKVQNTLSGRCQHRVQKHTFQFSRLIHCQICSRALIAEAKKEIVYYRCHLQHTPRTVLKEEEDIKALLSARFGRLHLVPEEVALFEIMLSEMTTKATSHMSEVLKAEQLKLSSAETRIQRLTDAYLDGLIEKIEFEQKKTALTLERREVERRCTELKNGENGAFSKTQRMFELLCSVPSMYESGNIEEKRAMLELLTSNRLASHKSLDFTMRFPFSRVEKRPPVQSGCPPSAEACDFWRNLIKEVIAFVQTDEASDILSCR